MQRTLNVGESITIENSRNARVIVPERLCQPQGIEIDTVKKYHIPTGKIVAHQAIEYVVFPLKAASPTAQVAHSNQKMSCPTNKSAMTILALAILDADIAVMKVPLL